MEEIKNYYPPNAFRICIDGNGTDISGRIYTPLCQDEIEFQGIGEILLKMDALFDSAGYPQAFQEKRTFEDKKEQDNRYSGIPSAKQSVEKIQSLQGRLYTMDIIVCSRRNTTWQGSVYAADGGKLSEFSGEVELLKTLLSGKIPEQAGDQRPGRPDR